MFLNKQNKTAILVFAHSSAEELRQKPMAKNTALFDVLTMQTLQTVEKTGLPYFHFTEKNQVGTTFGERFTNAIASIFKKGYDQVITIGNDSPQLKTSHLLAAKDKLATEKFVIGPSTDGGFYLMGLHKSQFEAASFKKLAWQTAKLSQQLVQVIVNQGADIIQLEKLFDIDTIHDIKSIISYCHNIPKKVRLALLRILNLFKRLSCLLFCNYQYNYQNALHNKGSPVLLRA